MGAMLRRNGQSPKSTCLKVNLTKMTRRLWLC